MPGQSKVIAEWNAVAVDAVVDGVCVCVLSIAI